VRTPTHSTCADGTPAAEPFVSVGARAVTLVGETERKVLRLAIKHARDNVRRRVLAPAVLDRYRVLITSFEPRVTAVMNEETTEKQARTPAIITTHTRARHRVHPPTTHS
jgi:Zn-finger domain-containing protein